MNIYRAFDKDDLIELALKNDTEIEKLKADLAESQERVRELEEDFSEISELNKHINNFKSQDRRIVELESALTDWKHKVIQLTLRNRGLREALEWVQARYDIYTPDDVKQKVDKALEVRP